MALDVLGIEPKEAEEISLELSVLINSLHQREREEGCERVIEVGQGGVKSWKIYTV